MQKYWIISPTHFFYKLSLPFLNVLQWREAIIVLSTPRKESELYISNYMVVILGDRGKK